MEYVVTALSGLTMTIAGGFLYLAGRPFLDAGMLIGLGLILLGVLVATASAIAAIAAAVRT